MSITLDSGIVTISDHFCGAGGSSSGAVHAGTEVKYASNHWNRALETHETNHPKTKHILADLMHVHPSDFPRTTGAWFSPECPWQSNASGRSAQNRGQQKQIDMFDDKEPNPSGVRSRATMFCVTRFSEYHNYEFVIVENVIEATNWILFDNWLQGMDILGYNHEIHCLNAMFFHSINRLTGFAPQSRDRLYIVFWKKGNRKPDLDFRPWAWCDGCGKYVQAVQVWKNPKRRHVGKYGYYKKPGASYYYGCPTCVVKDDKRIVHRPVEPLYFSAWNAIDWSIPAPKISDRKQPLVENTLRRIRIGYEKYGRQPLIVPMGYTQATNRHGKPLMIRPLPTIVGKNSAGLCLPPSFIVRVMGDRDAVPMHGPIPTIMGRGNQTYIALPSTPFITEYWKYSSGRGVDEVLGTITGGGVHHYLTIPNSPYLVQYYGRDNAQTGIEQPVPTIPGFRPSNLVVPPSMLLQYHSNGEAVPTSEPLSTLTARDRHAIIEVTDDEIMECGFRMLVPEENKLGQGFPDDYVILGNVEEQNKQIGNAVVPPHAEFLVKACVEAL